MEYLTDEEQQHLMKYLPSIDTAKPPETSVAFLLLHSSIELKLFSHYHTTFLLIWQPQKHVCRPPILEVVTVLPATASRGSF